MAFVFKQGRFSTCTVFLCLLTIFLFAQKVAAASDSIIKYDCKTAGAGCGVSICKTNGSCSCPPNANTTIYDFACTAYTTQAKATCTNQNNCSKNGQCISADNCVCNEGYYGKDCSMARVQVACSSTQMFINVNPYVNNTMSVSVPGRATTCSLNLTANADSSKFGFAERTSGLAMVIHHNDTTCGDANVTYDGNKPDTKTYVREFQIQNIPGIKIWDDQVIKAECDISGNEQKVTFGTFSVNDNKGREGIDVTFASTSNVTLTVKHAGHDVSGQPVNLGDDLDFFFQMNSLHRVYKDIMIKQCTANNPSDATISVKLINDWCPNVTLGLLFVDPSHLTPVKSDFPNPSITLKIKAFMFAGQSETSQISFTCTVSFCEEACSSTITCPNTAAQPVVGRKRRSAINEADVSAVVTVIDPLANIKELRNTNQMEQCLQEPSFIATLATCGAVILILLIICIILATKLTRRHKKVSEADSGYQGPAFAMRIPRLSVSTSKEHFYHHD